MSTYLFTPLNPAELERLLYPVLPACLLFMVFLVLSVVIKVAIKNKFRTHR